MNPRTIDTRSKVVICSWFPAPIISTMDLAEDEKYGFQDFTEMTEKDEFQPKAGKFPVSIVETYKRLD